MRGPAAAVRPYAELARVSNVPTCLSNALVGLAIGAGDRSLGETGVAALVGVPTGIALLYVGGMALNDVMDVTIDRRERPSRPLPSGRISPSAARGFVAGCFAMGLAVIAPSGPYAFGFALALVVAIAAYDVTHQRHGGSVLLMGMCRGLVYLVAAAAAGWPLDLRLAAWLAAALALYIVTITWIARAETRDRLGARRWLALLPPLLVLAPMVALRPPPSVAIGVAAAALLAWLGLAARFALVRPPRTVQAILTWIAGICLVDAFFLTMLGQPGMALLAGACFALTAWGHRHVLGT